MNDNKKVYQEAKEFVRHYEQKLKQIPENYWGFNLNDCILVKLKEEGYEHWLIEYNKYALDDFKVTRKELKNKADDEGYVEFPTWEFMRIFGSTMKMGFEIKFELNVRFYRHEIKII